MIFAFLVAAADIQQPADDDPLETACYERDQSQLGMNQCAADAYARADRALNAQWSKVMARYGDDAQAKALLLDGQRAWLKYRDAWCEIVPYDNRGGSIWPMIHSGCLARLTRERTAEFTELLQGEE